MRLLLAAVAGVAAAALAAAILGEYELRGFTPVVSGILLGLVIAELVVIVAGRRHLAIGAMSGLLAAASVVWAAWISSGRDWAFFPAGGWIGALLGALTALAWGAERRRPPPGS